MKKSHSKEDLKINIQKIKEGQMLENVCIENDAKGGNLKATESHL